MAAAVSALRAASPCSTRDANLRTADLIADDFARVLHGEAARNALTAAAILARVGD